MRWSIQTCWINRNNACWKLQESDRPADNTSRLEAHVVEPRSQLLVHEARYCTAESWRINQQRRRASLLNLPLHRRTMIRRDYFSNSNVPGVAQVSRSDQNPRVPALHGNPTAVLEVAVSRELTQRGRSLRERATRRLLKIDAEAVCDVMPLGILMKSIQCDFRFAFCDQVDGLTSPKASVRHPVGSVGILLCPPILMSKPAGWIAEFQRLRTVEVNGDTVPVGDRHEIAIVDCRECTAPAV